MKKILICIPTYNRYKILDKQLKNLTSVDSKYFDIVCFDNCSTDNTEKVVLEYAKKFNHISYVKNKINVGYNGNIVNIIKYASTQEKYKYLFILSDDDLVFMSNFVKVCDQIDINKNELILLTWISTDTKGVVTTRPNDKNFENIYETVNKTALISSYMYPMVFIKKYNINEFLKFSKNTFLHLKIIADCINDGYPIKYYELPIGYEVINFEWRFDLYKTFCVDRYEATKYLDKVFNTSNSKQTALDVSNGLILKFIIWHIDKNYRYDKYFWKILAWKFKNNFINKKTFLLLFLYFLQKLPFSNKIPFYKRQKQKNRDGLNAQQLMIQIFLKQ